MASTYGHARDFVPDGTPFLLLLICRNSKLDMQTHRMPETKDTGQEITFFTSGRHKQHFNAGDYEGKQSILGEIALNGSSDKLTHTVAVKHQSLSCCQWYMFCCSICGVKWPGRLYRHLYCGFKTFSHLRILWILPSFALPHVFL